MALSGEMNEKKPAVQTSTAEIWQRGQLAHRLCGESKLGRAE